LVYHNTSRLKDGHIKIRLKRPLETIRNRDDLVREVLRIWESLTVPYIRVLYHTIPWWLQAVIASKGHITKYWTFCVGLTVCILYVEFHFFIPELWDFIHQIVGDFSCHAVNWELLGQFTSNFAQLLELIVLRSVNFLVKFRFFIQELWERKLFTNIVWMLTTGVSCALGAAVY
jgi:hypothetical protein